MGLFQRIFGKPQSDSMTFTQGKTFRGFKKIGIVSHGNKEAEAGLKKLCGANLEGKTIKIERTDYGYAIYVDNIRIGSVFPDTSAAASVALEALEYGNISEAFIKIDKLANNTIVGSLFVKIA